MVDLVCFGLFRLFLFQFLFLGFFASFFGHGRVVVSNGWGGLFELSHGRSGCCRGLRGRGQWQGQGGGRQEREKKFVHGINVFENQQEYCRITNGCEILRAELIAEFVGALLCGFQRGLKQITHMSVLH